MFCLVAILGSGSSRPEMTMLVFCLLIKNSKLLAAIAALTSEPRLDLSFRKDDGDELFCRLVEQLSLTFRRLVLDSGLGVSNYFLRDSYFPRDI